MAAPDNPYPLATDRKLPNLVAPERALGESERLPVEEWQGEPGTTPQPGFNVPGVPVSVPR